MVNEEYQNGYRLHVLSVLALSSRFDGLHSYTLGNSQFPAFSTRSVESF